MDKEKIVVVCLPELAPLLATEIKNLGFEVIKVDHKSVETIGTLEDTYILNHKLRTASKVLYQIGKFTAIHPNHLYKNLKRVEWEQWIPPNGYFSVDSFVKNEFIKDGRFANLRVKDAIVDRFNQEVQARPDSGSDKTKIVLFLHWTDKNAAVYLDTSGETLARHGYRVATTEAPMQEPLAAACLLQSGWDGRSHFVNPMCGSGTLAIEAALMAANRFPGDVRHNYSYKHVLPYNEEKHRSIKSANDTVPGTLPIKIIANDINRKSLSAARQNARAAGVEHLIEFKGGDFTKMDIPNGDGIIMMNPEYGERIGNEKDLEQLYGEIGDFFKLRCQGKKGYVFTGNLKAAKHIGLRTSSKTKFLNARIECRLLEYDIYEGSMKGK